MSKHPSHVGIRWAEPADAEQISLIAQRAFSKWVSVLGRKPLPMNLDYQAAIRSGEVIVATLHQEVVGFAKFELRESDSFVDVLAVTPQLSRHGIGSYLLRQIEAFSSQKGLGGVSLKTVESYIDNLLFYSTNGYEVVEHSTYEGVPVLTLAKSIESRSSRIQLR